MGGTIDPYVESSGLPPSPQTQYYSLLYPASNPFEMSNYDSSVAYGTAMLRHTIRSRMFECPGVRIGLLGYSQGAHVVNNALQGLTSTELSWIRGVVQLADPHSDSAPAYHIETTDVGGAAPRSTYGGILGRRALPSALHSRAIDYCFVDDVVCDSSGGFDDLFRAMVTAEIHGKYGNCCLAINMREVLGDWFGIKMRAGWTPPPPPTQPPPPPPLPPPPPPPPPDEHKSDVTGDGVADLVRYKDNGHVYLYPGRGGTDANNAFWSPRDLGATWGGTVSLALGDLNGDGIADLLRYKDNGHLYLYPGRGVDGTEPFWSPRDLGGTWGGTVSLAL